MSRSVQRTLKGFRDFLPAEKSARDSVERAVVRVFGRFGFQPVETPTLEYAELIMGKYGEEADRLVYTFEDRGGRRVALPYDQTVPTARVLTQYRNELPRMFRRYAIRNVFRAESPQRGRYREFRQCDIDIFGSDSPLAEAEIVACTWHAFREVGFDDVTVRVNDRQLLVGGLEEHATAEVDVFSLIRSIDKLDKMSAGRVVAELVAKGLDEGAARRALATVERARPTEGLVALLDYARDLGVPEASLEFSPMLARGLDYYTGAIFEVVVPGFGAGSVAGGGRYDGLIEQLGGPATPAVGIAFGFDRMVEAAQALDLVPRSAPAARVLVTVFGEETARASLRAAAGLRAAGIACEVYPAADKLGKQFKLADQKGIGLVVVAGPDEVGRDELVLRRMDSGEQRTIAAADAARAVAELLAAMDGGEARSAS